jgi:hypothetical protein
MESALDQFRQQHPEYDDMSDRDLAGALHRKFYADIPEADYLRSLGLTAEDREQWGPMERVNNVVNQIGTGAYKGVAGLVGLPGTLSEYGAKSGLAREYQEGLARVQGRTLPPDDGVNHNPWPSGEEIIGAMETHLPGFKAAPAETRADKYLQAAGAGATAVVLPGGVLPNFVGGTAGGLASEGAGQLTEGTAAEPYARFLAGLIGGVGASAGINRMAASNVEQLVAKATMGTTVDDWTAAIRLQEEAAARGAPITSAEALAQVTGGNRTMMGMQRTVEQMPETAPTLGRFMAQRPAQNEAALASQLDQTAMARPASDVGEDIQALGARHIQNTYGPTVEGATARAEQARRGIGPTMGAEDAGRIIQQRLRQGADTATEARAAAAGPQFEAARSSQAVVNTDAVTALTARYMLEGKGRLQELAQQALATMRVGNRIAGAPDTSVTGLMASRKALGDMISAESRAGNNEAVRMLTDIRGGLDDALAQVPEVAGANDTFALLSRNLTDRYGNPTVAPIIERDQFGRSLTMPPERVAGSITAGGPSGVDDFTAAADRTALDAYRQNLTRDILTKATGADGAIDPKALRRVLADNDDLLRRFPEIRERFSTASRAQTELDEAYSILRDAEGSAIGGIAQTPDWKKQVATILDDSPGSERRAADLVRTLSQADTPSGAQRVAELLRIKIQDTFNRSLPNAKGQMEEFRGANFAGGLSKNPQALRSLEAAIAALPDGRAQWAGFRRLLDVFEAQGQRLPSGSPTSFNQQLAGDLERNLGRGVKSFGTDLWAKWNIQRRSQELARILTDPDGVALLQRLAVEGPNTARAQQMVQAFYQGGQAGGSSEPVIDIRRAAGPASPGPSGGRGRQRRVNPLAEALRRRGDGPAAAARSADSPGPAMLAERLRSY